MFGILAGLIYLAAIAIPLWLIHTFRAVPKILHLAAGAAALAIGLAPGTPLLETTAGTFLYGFVFFFLAVWGIGGLLTRKKHPDAMAHRA
jgi:hypothetical protein